MSDVLEPGEALDRAADLLRISVPLAEGFPARIDRRRVRRRSQRRLLRGGTVAVLLALAVLAIRPSTADRSVTFTLDAPSSHSVALVGDFTDWRSDQIKLHQESGGKWAVTVKLPPGRYRFSYLVDNDEWRADADATPIPDDYGRPTSVMTVSLEP